MKRLITLLILLVFNFCSTAQGSVTVESVVDTSLVNHFRSEHQMKRSLRFQEVFEDAEKLFKKGRKVDRSHLDRNFTQSIWNSGEYSEESGVSEINLFNGSNGIIGKQVTLFLDENDVIIKVGIVGWGR